MASNHMNSFTTLIKRLEAATSRLEDMASSLDGSSPISPAPGAATPSAAPESPKQASLPPPPPPPPVVEPTPVEVEDFDALINKEVKSFVDLGDQLGGLVAKQSKAFLRAFEAQRTWVYVSLKAKKPESPPLELMAGLREASEEITNIKDANRPSHFFNHLSAVADGLVFLSWFFDPRPVTLIQEALSASQFYGNRVITEYKGKNATHVAYIQAYYQIFKSLIEYIKNHYVGGLTWNNKDGVDVTEALKQIESKSGSGAAPPPPPPPPPPPAGAGGPPPPPPPPAGGAPPPKASSGGDMSAVFDQLNQGSAITSGLRKVDKSEMTHKNPNLRSSSLVPDRTSRSEESSPTARGKSPLPSKKPKPESMRVKKPAKKQLDGNKWYIEHYENTSEVIEISAQLSHSILISHCNKAIVKVSNKANAISIDNCTNLSLIVDSLVSSIDVIKSPKFALQIDGVVPTVLLDQVDGATIYLSQTSLDSEVFSSKCSNVNIVVPAKEGSDEDDKECPVPEQIRTVIKDGVVVSEIVEHAG